MRDNKGMRLITLILISAILSACAKSNDPQYTDDQLLSSLCTDLNSKYADKTKAQLYGLKEQARQAVNYYMADNKKFEFYTNAYNEYKLAAECK